jgi:2'-5' RNA ligase
VRVALLASPWALPLHLATGASALGAFVFLWLARYQLARLAAASQVVFILWGWALAQYPYAIRPHLTLARSDGVPAGAAIGARLIEAAEDIEVRFRAARVGLFESLTGGGPARYEPVEVVDLT